MIGEPDGPVISLNSLFNVLERDFSTCIQRDVTLIFNRKKKNCLSRYTGNDNNQKKYPNHGRTFRGFPSIISGHPPINPIHY